MLASDFQDGFGQGVVALAGERGGVLAVVFEGNGLAGRGGMRCRPPSVVRVGFAGLGARQQSN